LSIISNIFGISIPSLNTGSAGVEVYIKNFHAYVKDLLIQVGTFMSNTLGNQASLAAQNSLLTAFANFPQDRVVRKPFREIYLSPCVRKQVGNFPFVCIPKQIVDQTDLEGQVALLTNTADTAVIQMDTAAMGNGITGVAGGANYGSVATAIVLGASLLVNLNVERSFNIFMPNWSIIPNTGIEVVFTGGDILNTDGIISTQWAQNGTEQGNSARYFLYNDFFAPIVKGIEPFLIRVNAAGFGL